MVIILQQRRNNYKKQLLQAIRSRIKHLYYMWVSCLVHAYANSMFNSAVTLTLNLDSKTNCMKRLKLSSNSPITYWKTIARSDESRFSKHKFITKLVNANDSELYWKFLALIESFAADSKPTRDRVLMFHISDEVLQVDPLFVFPVTQTMSSRNAVQSTDDKLKAASV